MLLVRRPPGGELSELWELPGGKGEPGEQPEEAVRRELHEELGSTACHVRLADRFEFTSRGRSFELHVYDVFGPFEQIVLTEHDEWRWVSLEESLQLPLVPSDRAVLERTTADHGAAPEESI